MANRTFMDQSFTVIKREVRLYCAVLVGENGAVTLEKWNYPTLGTGTNARTYTAAATATVPSVAGNYPLQYSAGSEGVLSVTRTGTGLWTIRLQDNYQRCLMVLAQQVLAGGAGNIVATHQNSSITNMGAGGGSLIGIALESATATVADPTAGSAVLLTILLQDATEP